MTSRTWLRAGIILLIALDGLVGIWQYFFPRSFYEDFPTVRLDPPYNEHLVSDVGGLNIALVGVLIIAAVYLEQRLVTAALTGFALYSLTHFAFHVRHFDHFSLRDAVGVGTGLGFELVLTVALLVLNLRMGRRVAPVAAR
ncbi:hypothetical protein [Actinoplanes awajinensis]|uniref:hypothetical protein n=1 Tax=Actinoplanes awajinensis TaxID=135946 RepID=UPI000834CA90|nr:hypothetical protein [Actinoplanes awajinensis]